MTLIRRLAAEALGTTLLLATVVGSGVMGEQLAGGNAALALLANAVATGAMLVVLITVLGPVSGAHFNPLVSLVMALRRNLTARDLALYSLAQLAGALAGVWAAHAMFGLPLWQVSGHIRTGPGQWFSEAVAAFGLVAAILGAARWRPDQIAVTVGLYILAAYWFTASTSFANPAVTLARSLTDSFSGIAPASTPGFIAAQIVGGLLGWLVMDRLILKETPA